MSVADEAAMPVENHPPFEDPFIDEVRALKERASARFDHDLGRIFEHPREIERRVGQRARAGASPPRCPLLQHE